MAGLTPTDQVLAQLQALGINADEQRWSQPTVSPLALTNMGGKLAAKPVVPEALQGLFNALALPGETLAGKYEGMDQGTQTSAMLQDALGASLDLGMPATVGATGRAASAGVDPELLNIFIGPRGARNLGTTPAFETADKAFQKLDYRPQYSDLEAIFRDTGVFPGAEGILRQEIPDYITPTKHVPDIITEFNRDAQLLGPFNPPMSHRNRVGEGDLKYFLNHPALYEAYPDMANIGTKVVGRQGSQSGVMDYDLNHITAEGWTPEDITSVLLHEATHGIQKREGFPRGSNPDWTKHLLSMLAPQADQQLELASPYAIYNALMGEVEARNVQKRYELGTAQDTPFAEAPPFTEDVPRLLQLDMKRLVAPDAREKMLPYLKELMKWDKAERGTR